MFVYVGSRSSTPTRTIIATLSSNTIADTTTSHATTPSEGITSNRVALRGLMLTLWFTGIQNLATNNTPDIASHNYYKRASIH